MAYAYEDLGEGQFEQLVVQMARKLLGPGVQSFAAGVDGGRDGRFEGTADGFPSRSDPWTGITIIQAKHTNGYNAHYSDPKFFGESESCVLAEELVSLQRLVRQGAIRNYVLFSNRRLSGISNEKIVTWLSENTGIASGRVHLVGIERMEEFMREFPELPRLAGISPFDGPLLVSSRELADVVEAMAEAFSASAQIAFSAPTPRVPPERKNALNNMSTEYFEVHRKRYVHLFKPISDFLSEPLNGLYVELYDSIIEEFESKIVAHRTEFQSFDRVLGYLFDLLLDRDALLARNKRITKALLFYMYWHCDLGETNEAVSE